MARRSIKRAVIKGSGLSALALAVVGCNLAEPPPFDPHALTAGERGGAADVQTPPLHSLPTTLEAAVPTTRPSQERTDAVSTTGPALGTEPVVRMSLQEAVHRAVANNHEVRVAGYQPAIDTTRITEAEAQFDPRFFTNFEFDHKNELTGGAFVFQPGLTPATSTTVFSNVAYSDTFKAQTGIKQQLENGAQVQLQYEVDNTYLKPRQFLLNPFYTNELSLQITQPLLRDFGNDVNRARIVINRDTQKISMLDFRKAVEQNVSDIEKVYWQMVEAERNVRDEEQQLALTESTYQLLYERFQRRVDVTDLQLAQTQSSIESRRAALIQSKTDLRKLSDQLKQLMSDPEFPVSSAVIILPASQPLEEPVRFDFEDQVNTAMENRLELGQQELKIDQADVTIGVARNNLLPQLNLVGSVGVQGLGGNEGDALSKQADFDHLDYAIGLQLEIPLGNRAARAIWKRTLLQRMQAIEQYQAFVTQIATDVRQAMRDVDSAYLQIRDRRESRFAAEKALATLTERQQRNIEPLNPTSVQLRLNLQDLLTQAQEQENASVANYNIAIANLERAKGTLLRYDNVLMQESPEIFGEPLSRGGSTTAAELVPSSPATGG